MHSVSDHIETDNFSCYSNSIPTMSVHRYIVPLCMDISGNVLALIEGSDGICLLLTTSHNGLTMPLD